jgi:hypothetical protein
MTLSAFTAFCVGYADIEPFVQGWSKYFQLRKQSAQEPRDKNAPPETAKEKKGRPMTQCGATTVMSRKGSDFLKIKLLESCKKWQKKFFYVKNTTAVDLINLPEYVDVLPTEMKNWTFNPRSLVETVNDLHWVMGELTNSGLTPKDIIACFICRRVSPLQRWTHKICQMSGAMDPTRHSTHKLSLVDILRRVKDICKTTQTVFAWGQEPYNRERPAPPINHLALANIFV